MQAGFIGIDIGTQGARVILVDQLGGVIASTSRSFILDDMAREEQSPMMWWDTCTMLLDEMLDGLPANMDKSTIQAVSVTSTSGTVIPLDSNNQPVHAALMYSDGRSAAQAKRIHKIASKHIKNGYVGFNASCGISKMCWFMEAYPDKSDTIALWIHAADYIVGQLSGQYQTTDYTNALKSGYDLERLEWPPYLINKLGVKKEWLQTVVPSGTVVGSLRKDLAMQWGLKDVRVVVGITDGCASQIASGAVKLGDWNTTIGTTLVIKGVTKNQLIDPLGRLYSHRHPEGYWMPGGASNTGADWITMNFPSDIAKWNQAAEKLIPTGKVAWPLLQEGERYPVSVPYARAIIPEQISKQELYAANLEGVACIERLAYEIIEELSGEKIVAVYTAGGGSNSDVWLRIRASVLNVPIYKCKAASGALGAAIMAASNTYYRSVTEAASQMTTMEKEVYPDDRLVVQYEKQYQQFKQKLKALNYL
ncbi:FGGY-family carbohydrate kinase [Sphingobacterium gobiense]|uniref:Carbohydrate kinase n=1 Tax=Sphingobacterium gobiense TaxID=1382456 RepID=A0A2S9JR26_9SPHI|nr:FGGY-family carbohydrate kinase [Sphingobacterium gobiense]PRD55747.1 carbohydrate kinase [Sphingobacterium gobiense]